MSENCEGLLAQNEGEENQRMDELMEKVTNGKGGVATSVILSVVVILLLQFGLIGPSRQQERLESQKEIASLQTRTEVLENNLRRWESESDRRLAAAIESLKSEIKYLRDDVSEIKKYAVPNGMQTR